MNVFLRQIRDAAALQHRLPRVDWRANVEGLIELHAPRLATEDETVEEAKDRLRYLAHAEMGWNGPNDGFTF